MNDRTESPGDRAREEQLERYVLGRLSPDDRAAFEARLAADPDLRESLARERSIREGVRRVGREELKRRLAEATRTAPRPGVPWGRVAALAAMILIVTGIALWQRWFLPAPSGDSTVAEPMAAGQSPGMTTADGPATADLAAPPSKSTEPERDASRDQRSAGPGLGASVPQPAAEAKKPAPQPAAGNAGELTYESGGVMLPEEITGRARQHRMKGDAAARPDQRPAKTEARNDAGESRPDTRTYRVEIVPGGRNAATAESAAGGAAIADTIHFTVRVKGDSVTIALPASAVGLTGLRAAEYRVTRVSPDSVIIEAGGVRIRGFIPGDVPP